MNTVTEPKKEPFFTKDPAFFKTLFSMMLVVALQNLVAYSVNMADNIMLGSYRQDALSGAATVNQIFFMVQQIAMAIGNSLVVLSSQYWGEKRTAPIRALTGIALKFGVLASLLILAVCMLLPVPLLRLFTDDMQIIAQGQRYLALVQWTFALYILTNILMSVLRSVGTVKISFYISIVSLLVNVAINYVLIFGHFGFPELGVVGAAVGTLAARILELVIVVVYLAKFDRKLKLFSGGLFAGRERRRLSGELSAGRAHSNTSATDHRGLRRDYARVVAPNLVSQILWGVSVPIQTAILGHLSTDAIAANSVATTFYQYLKVIVVAMSSASAVMIGNAIGKGDHKKVKSDARTLCVIDVAVGLVLGLALFLLRGPLLSFYNLTDDATEMALNLIALMSLIMVGMSYQMPVSSGIIQGGGDVTFTMKMNLVSVWLIVMPLSFAAAFWWKWPVEAVVLVVQSDQIFKGLPTFLRFRSYKWMKKLTN